MKLDPHLTPLIKINLKQIKDLNVRPDTITLLKENIEKNLFDMDLGNYFLDMIPKAQANKIENT